MYIQYEAGSFSLSLLFFIVELLCRDRQEIKVEKGAMICNKGPQLESNCGCCGYVGYQATQLFSLLLTVLKVLSLAQRNRVAANFSENKCLSIKVMLQSATSAHSEGPKALIDYLLSYARTLFTYI